MLLWVKLEFSPCTNTAPPELSASLNVMLLLVNNESDPSMAIAPAIYAWFSDI